MSSADSAELREGIDAASESGELEQQIDTEIAKISWIFKEGVIVPYYLAVEYQDHLEGILPHEQFEGKVPFEELSTIVKKKRFKGPEQVDSYFIKFADGLVPFMALYRTRGYVGLDAATYSLLGKTLRDEQEEILSRSIQDGTITSFPIRPPTFVGSRILRNYVYLGLLKPKVVSGKKVYFPTEKYVRMNVSQP